jgi:hypothetical protein
VNSYISYYRRIVIRNSTTSSVLSRLIIEIKEELSYIAEIKLYNIIKTIKVKKNNVFYKQAPYLGKRPIIARSLTAQPQHVMS